MKIQGTFKDITNTKTYWVQIGRSGINKYIKSAEEYDPEDTESIYFAKSPVIISSDLSDTFENVYIRQCSITLTCNYDIRPDIVANNYADLPVVIRYDDENGNIIFSGFVAPLSFNQPYAKEYNEITLECYDKLGTLEYMKFQPLLSSYNLDTPRHFMDIILNELNFSTITYNIEYDYTENTKINPIIFIGESEDSWMNCKEVLEEIGKIYGCFFFQNGDTCIVENILLYDLSSYNMVTKDNYKADDTNISIQEAYNRIELQVDLVGMEETLIDPFADSSLEYVGDRAERVLSEIWYDTKGATKGENLLKFRDIIWSINANNLWYRDWQQYPNTDENFYEYDYYCRVMQNTAFDFGNHNYLNDGYGSRGDNVYWTLDWLHNNPGKAAFLEWAKTDNLVDTKKRFPLDFDSNKKQMLVIQVGGHGCSYNASTDYSSRLIAKAQALETQFTASDPICSITVQNANNFIPSDVSKTNYLVITGTLRLNPLQPRTGYWYEYPAPSYGNGSYNSDIFYTWNPDVMSHNTVQTVLDAWGNIDWNNGMMWIENQTIGQSGRFSFINALVYKNHQDSNTGGYYQHYCWDNSTGQWPFNQIPNFSRYISLPYLTPSTKMAPYDTSTYVMPNSGGEVTNVTKLALLTCELTIGEGTDKKYLVENLNILQGLNYKTIPYELYSRIYQWKKYDDCPTYNGVKQTWFTIGVTPDKGDWIIGNELSIQNTVSSQMELPSSVKGTAIPITSTDQLQGKMEFKILGPYNARWTPNNIVKHGWEWQKYFGYNTGDRYIMDYVENIQITDFKINAYANGQISRVAGKKSLDDKDLVYYSHTNDIYKENKDYKCKICTCLTEDNAEKLGIVFGLSNSTIITTDNEPFYGMDEYDDFTATSDDDKVKLEEARVSEQYYIWKRPRNIIQSTLSLITPENSYINQNYVFNYLKYKDTNNTYQIYRILSREIDLQLDNMNCVMKEISDEPTQ